MTFTVTIDSTPVAVQDRSLSIEGSINARQTLSAVVRSMDGSYRPSIGDEIVVTQDGTDIFGGTIEHVSERAVEDNVSIDAIDTSISAIDFRGKADRRVLLLSRPSETLKVRITYLATLLDSVTVHASQVTGPTLEAVSYDGQTVAEALTEMGRQAGGYGWDIDASSVLRMQLPSANTAPFNLTVASGIALGDIEVEPSREDYANRVLVRAGGTRVVSKTDVFTGDGVEDTWTLTYTPVTFRGLVTVNGGEETLGAGATWEYDAGTNTITRTAGAVTNTHSISIVYGAQFPIYVEANDAGEISSYGIWDVLVEQPTIFDKDEAQAFADAELATRLAGTTTVRYSTYSAGLKPGQQQTVTVAARDLSSVSGVVTDVVTTNDAGINRLRHAVTVQTGAAWTTWLRTYEAWGGGSGSGTASVSGGIAVVPSVGQDPTGNGIAQRDTVYETEIGLMSPDPVIGSASQGGVRFGVHASTSTEMAWFLLNRPGPFSGRGELVFFDNRDGASNGSPLSLRYDSTVSRYVLGPPAASIAHSAGIDIGSDASGKRIANVNATNLRAATAIFERGRTVAAGEWQDYTPTWAASGTAIGLGDATRSGRYALVGKTCYFRVALVMGSTTTFGTGTYTFTLPQTSVAVPNAVTMVGVGSVWDASPSGRYTCTARLASTTTVELIVDTTGAQVGQTAPITFAQSDQIGIYGSYEMA